MECSIIFKQPNGKDVEISCALGQTLMSAAISEGVQGILAECGGCCACGTCHVYVQEEYLSALPSITSDESDILDNAAAERRRGSRLSCQVRIVESLDGMMIEIPENQI
jgi:2Fe-2S ferredoxin